MKARAEARRPRGEREERESPRSTKRYRNLRFQKNGIGKKPLTQNSRLSSYIILLLFAINNKQVVKKVADPSTTMPSVSVLTFVRVTILIVNFFYRYDLQGCVLLHDGFRHLRLRRGRYLHSRRPDHGLCRR